jgi:tRNA-modifying protein YgfZ
MPRGFDLGQGTVIRFRGADRCRVFNNLCTQDLRKLSDRQAFETFVTDVKGRTFGHGVAMSMDSECFLITVPDQGAKLVPHYDRYIIREDAIVTDVSNEFQFWLFEDRAVAAKAFAMEVDATPAKHCVNTASLGGNQICLVHAPWIGPESILALVPAEQGSETIAERLGSEWRSSDMSRRADWELARIEAFWPWYGVDLDDRHLPQELDRDASAISFNKGCYLGQETIARLDMLGKVQKKLVKLLIETSLSPAVHSTVHAEGKEVGTIFSVAQDEAVGQCLALAYVKRSHFVSGQVLDVNGCKATVC